IFPATQSFRFQTVSETSFGPHSLPQPETSITFKSEWITEKAVVRSTGSKGSFVPHNRRPDVGKACSF
ncbi:MAG: hypothetical protein WA822_04810, partial [Albidovulum sp.]